MAAGDGITTAKPVGQRLGIDEVHGEVKLVLVARLQGEGRIVAMAGDGINGAPPLAKGDLRGIARARLMLSRRRLHSLVKFYLLSEFIQYLILNQSKSTYPPAFFVAKLNKPKR